MRRSSTLPFGAAVTATLLIGLAMVIAASTFWPIHQSVAVLVAVGVALAAGTLIAVLGAALRWNSVVVGAATIVAYFLVGVPAAVPGAALFGVLPTVPGLRELLVGISLSWKELLTISLPVGDYEALLVPVFALVLVLTVVSLTVALRARWGELAALGPAVLLVAGILLGPTTASTPLPAALGLLVVLMVYLSWRRARRRSEAIRLLNEASGTTVEARVDRRMAALRTVAGTTVILAVAAGGAVAASAVVPATGPRDVLRSAIEKPFDPRDYPSPLSAFRRYFEAQAAESTMLTVDGIEAGERVRIATLDSYDGVVFTVGSESVSSASGTFTRVPFAIDRDDDDGRRATVSIEVGDYSGVWVPSVGALETIDFTGATGSELQGRFFFNNNSGTGAVLGGLDRGDSYEIDAVIPGMAAGDAVDELEPGTAPVPDAQAVPDEISSFVESAADTSDPAGERLRAVVEQLQSAGYISHGVSDDEPFSRSGHSAARLSELLTDQPMLGDAEQYAVAAALMARQVGFPSRVVLGFAAPDDATASSLRFSGADITAWIEVNTVDQGWIAIDPNPPLRAIPDEQPDETTKVARPQSVVQALPEEQIVPDDPVPPEVTEEEQDAPDPLWLTLLLAFARVLMWTVIAAAIIVAPFLAVIAAKWRRRARRRRLASPLARIGGGWAEFTDAAVDHGVEPAPLATRNEVALAVGGRRSLVLAAAVDRATFSPAEPTPADADAVWSAVAELRGSMTEGRTRWEKIKALVSIKSFARNREIRRRKGETNQ